MTTTQSPTFTPGDVVRYTDQANDATFIVFEVTDCPWSPFALRNVETFEIVRSDCRQAGWKAVA